MWLLTQDGDDFNTRRRRALLAGEELEDDELELEEYLAMISTGARDAWDMVRRSFLLPNPDPNPKYCSLGHGETQLSFA